MLDNIEETKYKIKTKNSNSTKKLLKLKLNSFYEIKNEQLETQTRLQLHGSRRG